MRTTCLVLVVATGLAAQAPASVTGSITVDKTKVMVKSGSAVSYPGATGQFVSVLLSDKPMDAKTFKEYTRIGPGERYVPGTFEGAWASMHTEKQGSGFTFSMDAKQQLLTNQILIGGQDGMFTLASDDLVLEIKSVSPRLTGRIRSREAVLDLGAHKVSLDMTFDLAMDAAGK